MAAGSIFISYRRADAGWAASTLHSDLVRRFGRRVFIDVDSIPTGDDFEHRIHTQVDKSDVLLAVIGRSWVTPALRDRRDYVRMEIDRALVKGKAVVPVLIDDAPMPLAQDIPYALKGLLTRQAVRVRRDSYRLDLSKLMDAVQKAMATAPRTWPQWFRLPWWWKAQEDPITNEFRERVPSEVLEELLRDPNHLHVATPQRREVTVMFTDLRGFTSLSEQMDPSGLTSYISDVLTPFTDAILRRRGTIDKYIGDSVQAFWGAPADDPAHAAHACAAALDMLDVMPRVLQELGEAHAVVPTSVGIGLATGVCIVGPAGARQRSDYSCLGATVDMASRVERFSKQMGVAIVLDETTAHAVADEFAVLELDTVTIKGMARGRRLYGLFGDEMIRALPDFQLLSDCYAQGASAQASGNWATARDAFSAARRHSVAGIPVETLCDRRLSAIP
jgi:class 3 adenylate cyclase